MKRLLFVGSLAVLSGLCLQNISDAHGGTYRGPGDTVPGGGGGGGGGGAGPSTGGPSGPSTGGPSGPTTGAPAGPAGVPTGGQGGRPATTATGSQPPSDPDLSTWDFWWGFNKDQYLNLKAAIYNGEVTGGDAEEFLNGTGTKKNTLRPSETAIRDKMVPALKKALEKERANDIVTGAMVALAKIGDPKNEEGVSEFEQIISKFLSSSSQEIAETSAVALGILANDGSVKALEHLLRDDKEGRALVKSTEVPWRTRAFAAYGLGLIGARTANNQVRQSVATILVEMIDADKTSTQDVKVACVTAFGLTPIDIDSEGVEIKGASSSRQAQVAYLVKLFKDERVNWQVRAHVPTAIARLFENNFKRMPGTLREDVVKLMLAALDEHSKLETQIQQSCVIALGQLGDSDADKLDADIRDRLKKVSKSFPDNQTKNFTLISMAQIGGRQGPGEDNEKGIKEIRIFLGEKLTKDSPHFRPWAGLAIGVMERAIADKQGEGGFMPSSGQKELLRAALVDAKQPAEQGAYAIGAGIARDGEAKDALLAKLESGSTDEARGYAAVALGLIGKRDAIAKIQEVVKKSKFKPDLLKSAAIGLGLLGDKELVLDLCKMLEDAKGLSSQAAIASALGFIGDSRSIDPLIGMLENDQKLTDSARGFAAVALGIVADKEPFPWNSKISKNINYRANTVTLTANNEGTGILDIL